MPFLFLLGNGRVDEEREEEIDEALKKAGVDAVIVPYHDPATGEDRYWFEGRNRGAPFDAWLRRETVDTLTAAGLWPVV